MAEPRNFVFYQNWRDFVLGLSSEADQLELLRAIMNYGVTGEYDEDSMSPIVRNVFVTMIKPAIDRAQKNYNDSIEYGKTHGRPKTVNDDAIRDLAKSGMKAQEIADQLKTSVTSVYKSKGWKERKS